MVLSKRLKVQRCTETKTKQQQQQQQKRTTSDRFQWLRDFLNSFLKLHPPTHFRRRHIRSSSPPLQPQLVFKTLPIRNESTRKIEPIAARKCKQLKNGLKWRYLGRAEEPWGAGWGGRGPGHNSLLKVKQRRRNGALKRHSRRSLQFMAAKGQHRIKQHRNNS